jgi:LPXTG-site transpeptidase (sortase) family protein
VATPLVGLGLTAYRTVDVPHNPDRAGWFHRGPPPGQRGSAVILGHVDSTRGPAVFARLQELRPGDAVNVSRANGTTVQFVVLKSVIHANDDFPADRVYAAQGGRRLNLVTCGGIYDSTRGGYQSNLVVYTRRVPVPR